MWPYNKGAICLAKEIRELKNWKLWWVWLQYMRSHLDVFLEECLGVRLKDTQKVEARAIGNGTDVKIVSSRGYGKSWLIAHCAFGLAILYPETHIAIVSATAAQATIVMRKIRDFVGQYPEYLKEVEIVGRDPVPISRIPPTRLRGPAPPATRAPQALAGRRTPGRQGHVAAHGQGTACGPLPHWSIR